MESLLTEDFIEARKQGCKITKRWFNYQARQIYQRLYPERVSRGITGHLKYAGFQFSGGWFQGYRRRNGVAVRRPTKKAQNICFL